jgi:hypothetical protein
MVPLAAAWWELPSDFTGPLCIVGRCCFGDRYGQIEAFAIRRRCCDTTTTETNSTIVAGLYGRRRHKMEKMGADPAIDASAQPQWKRTGYAFFPYAAQQSGSWWVLRYNMGFPEHDLFTVFINGHAVADITGNANAEIPLIASVGVLPPPSQNAGIPALDLDIAATVVGEISQYVEYGSEDGAECIFCSSDRDGMTRDR